MLPTINDIVERSFSTFNLQSPGLFKKQLLEFGNREKSFCLLDSNQYPNSSIEFIAAIGVEKSFSSIMGNDLADIDTFINQIPDYIFCHISYDLKNKVEALSSSNYDGIGFPDFYFFQPAIIVISEYDKVHIGVLNGQHADFIFDAINSIPFSPATFKTVILESRFSRQEYRASFEKIMHHINSGDCYEVCFCQEFFKENIEINPIEVFKKLMLASPTPFAAFYKLDDKYLLCASPERFLSRRGKSIFSQPIKGTAQRNREDKIADERIKVALKNSLKERSENIMIVDLVRNDLSKISSKASVNVSEFLEIYTYPQVHQMISTVEAILGDKITFSEIIKATFPMGSMTGAPKKRAMEIIEEIEKTKRGLFSGTIGYLSPERNFDLNVVIRSLLYNAKSQYLSVQAGSAITHLSNAEHEYEECLIKMQAMQAAIS